MTAVLGAGFRAFSAASQGDWHRATREAADIPAEEWPAFVAAVVGLSGIAQTQRDSPRRHRLCDACAMHNHSGCTGYPCGCTSEVCHPSDPPATPPE